MCVPPFWDMLLVPTEGQCARLCPASAPLLLLLSVLQHVSSGAALTLTLLTWRIWRAPNNASRWQMGFNSAFKGLIMPRKCVINRTVSVTCVINRTVSATAWSTGQFLLLRDQPDSFCYVCEQPDSFCYCVTTGQFLLRVWATRQFLLLCDNRTVSATVWQPDSFCYCVTTGQFLLRVW